MTPYRSIMRWIWWSAPPSRFLFMLLGIGTVTGNLNQPWRGRRTGARKTFYRSLLNLTDTKDGA